jgi:DNA (cytosine-5)-methyltransferase 1
MAEIAARIGSNGLSVVSTFSGCGGSCLGFEMAGYRVLWANEFVEAARDVYSRNHPDVMLDSRDIRDVEPENILQLIGKSVGEIDVLEGSPPCSDFSTAGKRQKGWGQVKKYSDTTQRVDDLFFEYVRLLDGLRPRVFVAENVSGLVKGTAYGYFELILRAMRRCGYRVRSKVLDAQWLGVPQERRRVIFIGVRDDLEREPAFPMPLPYRYTIRDALPWIGALRWDSGGMFAPREYNVAGEPVGTITTQTRHFHVIDDPSVPPDPRVEFWRKGNTRDGTTRSIDEPSLSVMAHGLGGVAAHQALIRAPMPPEEFAALDGTAIGNVWPSLVPGRWHAKYKQLQRPIIDKPCPTITAVGGGRGVASVTHPNEPRKFTIFELRRLCGFPDDFVLTGKFAQQWERLGRSVPPVMMSHVAATLRDQVLL